MLLYSSRKELKGASTSCLALRQDRKAVALDPNKYKYYDDPNPSIATRAGGARRLRNTSCI